LGEENQPILGGKCEVATSHKITQERDKNKVDQHPNTPISFKRGINTGEENINDFSSP